MSESIIRDNYFLLYSLILGVCVTILYDILRIFRRVIKHKDALVSIEDLLYWIVVAISVFYVMHTESNGTLRWFAILGAAIGMGIYKKTLSTPFVNFTSKGLQIVLKFLGKISNIILKPFKVASRKCSNAAGKAGSWGIRAMRVTKKKLTRWLKTLKMVLCKHKS